MQYVVRHLLWKAHTSAADLARLRKRGGGERSQVERKCVDVLAARAQSERLATVAWHEASVASCTAASCPWNGLKSDSTRGIIDSIDLRIGQVRGEGGRASAVKEAEFDE